MKIGSLFSGAGGLDMAVEHIFGGEVVWHCEQDKAASKVLAHRWPGVPNLGDITAVDWTAVEPVDLLCGGFPCTDVSAAGKRAGIAEGTRSGLWSEMAVAIGVLRPSIIIIENVRGLLSARAHRNVESADTTLGDQSERPLLRAAGAVLGDLADLGYDARWATVSAASVGAPHRRERVFIVATIADSGGAAVGMLTGGSPTQEAGTNPRARSGDPGKERTHPNGRNAPDTSRNGWHEGRPEPARLAGGSDAAVGGDADGRVALLPTPTAQAAKHAGNSRFGGGNSDESNLWQIHHLLLPTPLATDGTDGPVTNCASVQAICDGSAGRNPRLSEMAAGHLLPTPNASDGTGGGQHPDKREGHSRQLIDYVLLCSPAASDGAGGKTSRSGGRIDEPLLGGQAREMATAWGKYEPAIRRWESLTRPAPAPTEPNKNGNPRLAATFSEWLMGWPAGHVTDPAIGISRNDQLRIVGNGVCPQQAMAALEYLLAVNTHTHTVAC